MSISATIRNHKGHFFVPENWIGRGIGIYPWDTTAAKRRPAPMTVPGHVQITKKAAMALLRLKQVQLETSLQGTALILRERRLG